MKQLSLQSLACAAALLAPLCASADIIPQLSNVASAGPGAFTWSYNLGLTAEHNAMSGLLPSGLPQGGPSVQSPNRIQGSFLTVYDFAGYVAGSCTSPAGWVCRAQNLGFTPSTVTPDDDAGIVNLTWQYATGPTINGLPNGVDLGLFTAQSIFNTIALTDYTARGFNNGGQSAGNAATNAGTVGAPSGTAIPEPGTLALAGAALALLGAGRRRRPAV